MKVPSEFDDIRPYEPDELPGIFNKLLADPQFRMVLAYVFPDVPFDMLRDKMLSCKNNLEFQVSICYKFLENLLVKTSKSCDIDVDCIDVDKRYTFISNHRDIVLDSAFLDKMLIDAGFNTTCEIAIGDNLLSIPWVKDFVRVNKSFIVKRGLPPRETLMASRLLSDYMYFVVEQKHDNIWIAQREGRAKDSNDLTQPAILKMMAMGGGRGSVAEKLGRLHLVPLTISYEYDPCDFLKAKEFQQKRDVAGWKKGRMDDVISMQTGIMGYKGNIHYHCAPCIDDWLDSLDPDIPKTEIFDVIAKHIDKEIHSNYRLFPSNYVALDILDGTDGHSSEYTPEERRKFETYLDMQIAKIDLPDKDEDFLRGKMLAMYANPAINFMKSKN